MNTNQSGLQQIEARYGGRLNRVFSPLYITFSGVCGGKSWKYISNTGVNEKNKKNKNRTPNGRAEKESGKKVYNIIYYAI